MIRQFTQSEFLFILGSARWTLLLTLLALTLGGGFGFVVAIARTSRLAPLRLLATTCAKGGVASWVQVQ